MKKISRREFTKKSALGLGVLSFSGLASPLFGTNKNQNPTDLNISIFSKHLQFLDYKDLGEQAAEMGFNGVDLTVRPKGHVLPESVSQNLPKAIEAINQGGSTCHMMTTAIDNIDNQTSINILKTASNQGIKYYRTNWFKYAENQSMESSLIDHQKAIKKLNAFNQTHGLIGCYQNHAGTSIGASMWEIKKLLEPGNLIAFGVQYDIRHAVVEGGLSWKNGLRLIQENIKTIVLKDFKWEKTKGHWKLVNTPIGDGMVDFDSYFKLLKKYQIQVPVSLHCEYDLGGAEHGSKTITIDKKEVYRAISKDLVAIKKLWNQA
jgi:sugar phosphate isomerase/epimerase